MNFKNLSQLLSWGWDASWARQWIQLSQELSFGDGVYPARVIGQERQLYRVNAGSGDGEEWAQIPGKWMQEDGEERDFPGVGDWLALEKPSGSERAVIVAMLPRRTLLARKAAGSSGEDQVLGCNVDGAWVVASINHDLSAERVERYLALISSGGAIPTIVLSKADLAGKGDVPDADVIRQKLQARWPLVEVIAISLKTGAGLDTLTKRMDVGKTYVLLGSSGVGKSSLANHLVGRVQLAVQEVREWDSKGRHTTTGRHLLRLLSGALLMDTPGMRELQLSSEHTDLNESFGDLMQLEVRCRFTNCQHKSEPGCAVKSALGAGTLDSRRWDNYQKLKRETAFQEQKFKKSEKKKEKAR